MTEKKERFFIHKDIVSDTEMKIPITVWQNKEQQKKFCDELNKLNDENEQLKVQLKKGEDVCSICKYQYLTKRDTDEYYIAKCKKEHIECSKGTVNYCEDFKFKELSE